MATAITGATVVEPVILQTVNQDKRGRNWAMEVVSLTIGTNDATAYTFSTSVTAWPAATSAAGMLKIADPKFVTITGYDATITDYVATCVPGLVTITWTAAPTGTQVFLVKIEGFM